MSALAPTGVPGGVPGGVPWPGAVAVSGGGDSLALMLLLADWARASGRPPPTVLIVDHDLRSESAAEARAAARAAGAAGLESQVLVWRGAKPEADLEAAAREARYRLMGEWCRSHGIKALYVAHNREDLAETLLLRLARGSGLDGLAAMPPLAPFPFPGFGELAVARPLLGVGRSDLRDFLAARGIGWAEDPMNADPRFARARLRAAWPELAKLGLVPARIAAAARHLARAREALEAVTAEFLAGHSRFENGVMTLDGAALAALPRETGLRVLAAALGRVSGAAYRPRFERLERLYEAIVSDGLARGRTLLGCRIAPAAHRNAWYGAATLCLTRELRRKS